MKRYRTVWIALAIAALLPASPAVWGGEADGPARDEFSYARYAAVLRRHVNERGMVAYADLKKRPADLNRFLEQMAELDPKAFAAWNEPAKIAFWINAYNALTLKAIVDHYPIRAGVFRSIVFPSNSIRQISGVWDTLTFRVMGRNMTLDGIEHGVLRVEFDEPRIHVALVCAAMGCPKLRNEPYTGDKLDDQLNDQSKSFFADPEKFRIDRNRNRVHLSSIFDWFGEDFEKSYLPREGFGDHNAAVRSVLHYASQHLPEAQADYLRHGRYSVRYLDYDWSLNEQ